MCLQNIIQFEQIILVVDYTKLGNIIFLIFNGESIEILLKNV